MRVCLAAVILAAIAITGCGGDDSSETAATSTSTEESASACIGSFTSDAPDTLPRLASFSHDPGSPVAVGTYSGESFTAEIYDETTAGDGLDATFETGACVITEVSEDFGPLYLFVQADDGAWHRLLESDPKVPLVPDPESMLDDVEEIEIEEIEG